MSPGPVPLIVGLVVWLAILAVLWKTRRWLLFYLLGALGSIIFVVLTAALTGLDARLEGIEARQVVALSRYLGIQLQLLGNAGLAIPNHTGWGVFGIGIECSALLEMTAMAGLVLFYPAVYSAPRKAAIIVAGTALTYVFNILRILLIVSIINSFGTSWVFAAHAVFGRTFFFLATIFLYWRLVTRPTVRHVGLALEGAAGDE
jgi:exosortase family protein XrtG